MTEDFIQNIQFEKEDFIQNIQFDLFAVELVVGETATLLMAEKYVLRELSKEINRLLPLIYAGL